MFVKSIKNMFSPLYLPDKKKVSIQFCYIYLILQLLLVKGMNSQEDCPKMCTCISTAVVCDKVIPDRLPTHTENVTLYDIDMANHSSLSVFEHETWAYVKSLALLPDINHSGNMGSEKRLFDLRENLFINLKRLKQLRVTSKKLQRLERDTFNGLTSLEVLDLSDNRALTFENMISGLLSNNLYALHTLNLRRLSTLTPEIVHFDASFFKALEHTKLEVLDLSYTSEAILDQYSFAHKLPHLSEINFERAGYLATYFMAAARAFPGGPSFNNLKKVNLNYGLLPAGLTNPNFEDFFGSPLPQNFTELRARAYTPPNYSVDVYGLITNQALTMSIAFKQISLTWKLFALMLNLNRTEIALEVLDISENAVEHLDKSVTRYGRNLRLVNLSRNKLYAMDINAFEELLYNATALEEFYCSHNQLQAIPYTFFTFTDKIKIIDLSHNNLNTISFEVEHLRRIMFLNVSYNNIKQLDEISMVRIDNFINRYHGENRFLNESNNKTNKIRIAIYGNPFKCSCNSKSSVKWIVSALERNIFSKPELIKCELKGDIRAFDDSVVGDSEYLCNIPIIAAVSSIVCVIILIFITVIIIYIYLRSRKIKRKKRLLQFITKYKADGSRPRVPVFLSYCSADSEFVSQRIILTLNTKLQKVFATSEMCVSTGDLNFSPGFYVAEEIIKCIESCSVVIACVSRQFCKSHWCKDEVLTAKSDNKPIILMFLEHVDIKKMPKVLQKQFQITTRSKWTLDEKGDYSLTPDWDTFCKAVVKLIQAQTQSQTET